MAAGENAVFGADLDILFDSAYVEILDMKMGGFLNDPAEIKKLIDPDNRRAIYSLSSFSAKTGEGVLAIINARAKGIIDNTAMAFGNTTSVAAAGENEGLKTKNNLTFQIYPVPTATPTPTPTPTPMATLNFNLNSEAIKTAGAQKQCVVKINGVSYNKTLSSNTQGIFSGSITGLPLGTANIWIKMANHLSKKIALILVSGENTALNQTFFAGDINEGAGQANVVNVQDFNVLKAQYWQTGAGLTADINHDNVVNIQDFKFIGQNYLKQGEAE